MQIAVFYIETAVASVPIFPVSLDQRFGWDIGLAQIR